MRSQTIKFLVAVACSSLLAGCLKNKADLEVEPDVLEKPALSLPQEFTSLKSLAPITHDLTDTDISVNVITQIINLLDIANAEVGYYGESNYSISQLKAQSRSMVSSRSLNLIKSDSESCNNDAGTKTTIWEDINDNGQENTEDVWHILYDNCDQQESNASIKTMHGAISFSGLINLKDESIPDENFSDVKAILDIEMTRYDYVNNEDVQILFENIVMTYSREGALTTLDVANGGRIGVKRGDQKYLFELNALTISFEKTKQVLAINATHYNSVLNASFQIETPEALTFDALNTTTQGVTSGKMLLNGANNETLIFQVSAADEVSLGIDTDNDGTAESEDVYTWSSDLEPAGFTLLDLSD